MEKVGIRTLMHRLCQYSNSIYACPYTLVDEILSFFSINEEGDENEDKLIFYIPRMFSERNFSGLIAVGGQGAIIKCCMKKIIKKSIIEKNIAFKIAKPVISSNVVQKTEKANDFDSYITIPDARFVESSYLQNELEEEAVKSERNFVIPRVYCCGEKPVPFLGMAWIESLDIIHILKDKNDFIYSLKMFLKVLEAAKFFHYHNVVYRDFKAKNIKASHNDKIVILDFGLAKEMDNRNLTISGVFLGTLPYASHKICRGYADIANHLDDIHALGYCFWEFITHKDCPEIKENSFEFDIGKRKRYRSKIANELSDECQDIFLKATDDDEKERFQVVEEFEQEIINLIENIKNKQKEDFIPTVLQKQNKIREEKRMKGLTNRFLPVSFPEDEKGRNDPQDDQDDQDDVDFFRNQLDMHRREILLEDCRKNCKFPECQGRGICKKIQIAGIDLIEKIFF